MAGSMQELTSEEVNCSLCFVLLLPSVRSSVIVLTSRVFCLCVTNNDSATAEIDHVDLSGNFVLKLGQLLVSAVCVTFPLKYCLYFSISENSRLTVLRILLAVSKVFQNIFLYYQE